MSYRPAHPHRAVPLTAAGTSLAIPNLAGDTEGLYLLLYHLEFANQVWSAQLTVNGGETLLGSLSSNMGSPAQASSWQFASSGGGPVSTAWAHGFLFLAALRTIDGNATQRGFAGSEGNHVDSAAAGAAGQRIAAGVVRTSVAELQTLTIVSSIDMQLGTFAYLVPFAAPGIFG